ncbi:MAG: WcaF family extracellular polysaccharide biosynthesis acetyltransferase [Myxococcales bacterium]
MPHPTKSHPVGGEAGRVDLSRFDNADFERGASSARELAWIAARSACFERGPLPLSGLRARLLRSFGAAVGAEVVIRRGLRVTFPWKLRVGHHAWLGEDAWLMNLAPITLGANVVISQRAFLCTGNHDWSDPAFGLITKPIVVGDGAWIGASAFIAPGVTVGTHAVVAAGSVVTQDLEPYSVYAGNPCIKVAERRIRG